MRKLFSVFHILILPGIIFFLVSCSQGSCFEETESYLKASFYIKTTRTAPDTLTLYGLNNDSVIYSKSTQVQPALIPLNSSTDSCSFIILINNIADTIKFRYTSYPHMISKECGYTFYHFLDTGLNNTNTRTYHAIKKIRVSSQTITNLNVENIRIYY
jgi:hypothetical protein